MFELAALNFQIVDSSHTKGRVRKRWRCEDSNSNSRKSDHFVEQIMESIITDPNMGNIFI